MLPEKIKPGDQDGRNDDLDNPVDGQGRAVRYPAENRNQD
jgi:hypothetical protein